jgi:hypothetical protein
MNKFPIEAVDGKHDKSPAMPSQTDVIEILKVLWEICPRHPDTDIDWTPDGEFSFRLRRDSDGRIFRVGDFEGKKNVENQRTLEDEEDERTIERERTDYDGGPGCGGLDLLGKYTFKDSTVTIYVDSCRKAVKRYLPADSLDSLIKVVLIHELAHLMTHRRCLQSNQNKSDHFWEYTAQCATYAWLKHFGDKEARKVFVRLSPHQPFIYRTWESLTLFNPRPALHGSPVGDLVHHMFWFLHLR